MTTDSNFFDLLDKMGDIYSRKNKGYAGDLDDPPWNLKQAKLFGISPFKGCLIRISDKFSRIASLSRNSENDQVNEAITDTLLDMAIYSLIAICLYNEEVPEKNQVFKD